METFKYFDVICGCLILLVVSGGATLIFLSGVRRQNSQFLNHPSFNRERAVPQAPTPMVKKPASNYTRWQRLKYLQKAYQESILEYDRNPSSSNAQKVADLAQETALLQDQLSKKG